MKPIELSADLPAALLPDLEALFFFNPYQPDSRKGIIATVAKTGTPEIMQSSTRVWIGVPSGNTQCLFACETQDNKQRPVGVVLYSRPEPNVIWISHLAIAPDRVGGRHGIGLGCFLVEKVREIACQIKGVTRIQLPYQRDRFLPIRPPGRGPF